MIGLENSITVEKHMAEVFYHRTFGLILNLDMPALVGLGPSSFDYTVLELDIFHAAPFNGATLVIGKDLWALNVAAETRQSAVTQMDAARNTYNRDQLGFPSQEYV